MDRSNARGSLPWCPRVKIVGAPDDSDAPRLSLWERMKYTLVRPDDEPSERSSPADDRHGRRAPGAIHRSDDKERAIGLWRRRSPPSSASLSVTRSINNARTHHQSVEPPTSGSPIVLLGLAVLILVSSLLRKRLFQGITLALFGLAVFQLHYTYIGFAAPFILAGAWYLVRAYRLQQALKQAELDEGRSSPRSRAQSGGVSAPSPEQAVHAPHLSRTLVVAHRGRSARALPERSIQVVGRRWPRGGAFRRTGCWSGRGARRAPRGRATEVRARSG